MAKLINKMLNLVGWEVEEEEETLNEETVEDIEQPQFLNAMGIPKKQNTKVVNLHTSSQFKLVVMQPETFDDAQGICDHLKNKRPVIVNLDNLEKEIAQRIIDFLSGSVYTVDGNIQRVSSGIFIVAPNNVDITGDLSDELKNKNVFPWMK